MSAINNEVSVALGNCDAALKLVAEANALLSGSAKCNGVVFCQHHCDLLIERGFMCLFETLESYLEKVFIFYMLGERGINGNSVVRYVNPSNVDHAEKMLRGKEKYLDFTSRDTIGVFAGNFFQDRGPFSYLDSVSQDFEDMKKIRNKISHVSIKSQRDFESLVRSRISYLPTGVTVSAFLMETVPKKSGTFFAHYFDVTKGIINAIASPN